MNRSESIAGVGTASAIDRPALAGLGNVPECVAAAELPEFLERFLCATPRSRPEAFRSLAAALRVLLPSENADAMVAVFRRTVLPALDFTTAQALCRIHSQIRQTGRYSGKTVRLAVLGSFT